MSLPIGWAKTTLRELLPLTYGKSLIEAERTPNGKIPVYGSSGVVGFHSEALVSDETLVVGRKGTVGAVHHSSGPCWVIDTAYYVNPNLPLNWRFSYYLLLHLQLGKLDRSTAIPGLSRDDYNKICISVAPEAEQDRIVAEIEKQLTRLDDAVAALKRAQANLKRYRTSVLKAACEGRLVPTEAELARKEGRDYEPANELLRHILAERRARWEADQLQKMITAGKPPNNDGWEKNYREPHPLDTSNLPGLPEGWAWARAEQVCDFITKGTTPAAHKLHEGSGEIPYIKVYNLTFDGHLDFSYRPTFIDRDTHILELARSKVYPSDVLMNIVGPPLGKVSIVPSIHPEWNINQAIAVFRPIAGVDVGFLAYLLMTEHILSWATQRAKATAGQFNLTLELCRDLPVPLPPENEQKRITQELARRLTTVHALEAAIVLNEKRTDALRQSILRSAFEGKLVPQDPNDEPASILLERIRAERATGAANRDGAPKTTAPAAVAKPQRRRRGQRLAQRVSAGKPKTNKPTRRAP